MANSDYAENLLQCIMDDMIWYLQHSLRADDDGCKSANEPTPFLLVSSYLFSKMLTK